MKNVEGRAVLKRRKGSTEECVRLEKEGQY